MSAPDLASYGALVAAVLAFVAAVTVPFISGGLSRFSKISEFRQEWINELRKDIAEYLGVTQRWYHAYGKEEEKWKLFRMANEATVVFARIQMRINPLENEHKKEDDKFLAALGKLRMPGHVPPDRADTEWVTLSEEVIRHSRLLLKREWEVTKGLPVITWPWNR